MIISYAEIERGASGITRIWRGYKASSDRRRADRLDLITIRCKTPPSILWTLLINCLAVIKWTNESDCGDSPKAHVEFYRFPFVKFPNGSEIRISEFICTRSQIKVCLRNHSWVAKERWGWHGMVVQFISNVPCVCLARSNLGLYNKMFVSLQHLAAGCDCKKPLCIQFGY